MIAGDAGLLEAQAQLAAAEREAVARAAHVAAAPLALDAERAMLSIRVARLRRRVLRPNPRMGRQVGIGAETSTSLPLALGSHFTNSVLSANRGRMIVGAIRSRFPVPGL